MTLSLTCKRLNLFFFFSRARSFSGLWALGRACISYPPIPAPTPTSAGGVSKSGPSAFQLPGLEMAFQWISCHVAWRRVEVGQLGSKWGSQTLWGHRVGPRFAGAPSAPAFLVGRERAEPSTARLAALSEREKTGTLSAFSASCLISLLGSRQAFQVLERMQPALQWPPPGWWLGRQAEGGSLRRPERTAFSPPSSSRAHSHILAERLCLQLFWGQG